MTIKIKLDALNGKRFGRERRVVFRRKPQTDVSPNEFASKTANEIYDEISEPFLEIYNFLESKNLLSNEITEKIFDERDRLFWKFQSKEFDRTFLLKNALRSIEVESVPKTKNVTNITLKVNKYGGLGQN